MLKIDRNQQTLSVLNTPSLADSSITERYHLQEFIFNSPIEFFKEIGEELFLIGKEMLPSKMVQDRIDLLAIDKEGACVIIELKRGNNKLQMMQAISYAGMISEWGPSDFYLELSREQEEALDDFLECDKDDINRLQRIILIAEAYDYALLVGAEWLSERFGVGISCCRVALASDKTTNSEYLVCSNVYPTPELATEATSRGGGVKVVRKAKWPDWKTAMENVTNPAIVDFFIEQIDAGRESYLRKRVIHYRTNGKRRWFVAARQKNAYAWQQGRFENDVAFWRDRLSDADRIKPVKNDKCLRMFLETKNDLTAFHQAASTELQSINWADFSNNEMLEDDNI